MYLASKVRSHLIFGSNTDVGKTIVSACLARSAIADLNGDKNSDNVNYIKVLECGGSDETFIRKYTGCMPNANESNFNSRTLFRWELPASPHLASRIGNMPKSDAEVLSSLENAIVSANGSTTGTGSSVVYVETAGGVLSPSSASPLNNSPRHSKGTLHYSDKSGQDSLSWGWSTQADLYQASHLPVLLVGDGRLGGISSTLTSLESLIIRGYDVHGIVLIDDEKSNTDDGHGSNVSALREYVSRRFKLRSGAGKQLFPHPEKSIISLPPLPPHPQELYSWFDSEEVLEKTDSIHHHLDNVWSEHFDFLKEMKSSGKDNIWWPFTQHANHANTANGCSDNDKITLIDGAAGDKFSVLSECKQEDGSSNIMKRESKFDACASWWTQGLGHGESSLALAAAAAAGRYGHVIFPDVVHSPAVLLCQKLLGSSGPGHGWASRVFFSDNGSTAMEVSIKMGMKKFCADHGIDMTQNLKDLKITVCAQQDCYHGDTLGVMNVAEPSVFNEGQHPWYESKGLFLKYPTVSFKDGKIAITFPEGLKELNNFDAKTLDSVDDVFGVENRLSSSLYSIYKRNIQQEWDQYERKEGESRLLIGSVLIEPILLGAGGMKFIDPLWQRALMDVARNTYNVPVIFDEIASGLFRVGVQSCREILKMDPDIASYAKLLTGGLLPMSVTLASNDVFESFLGESKAEALLHGHSYTAHPVGCVSALHSLEAYSEILESKKEGQNVSFFDNNLVAELSKCKLVHDSMALGTVLAVTIETDGKESGYAALSQTLPIVKILSEKGIYARPLGNVLYIMVSPLTSRKECKKLTSILIETIRQVGNDI